MSDNETEYVELEVNGFLGRKKKIKVPKSSVNSVVKSVEDDIRKNYENKIENEKKKIMRKIAEENLSYKPDSTFFNFNESLNNLGEKSLMYTKFDLNCKNIKKDYTDPMLSIQLINPTPIRGFNISTSINNLRLINIAAPVMEAVTKFKKILTVEEKEPVNLVISSSIQEEIDQVADTKENSSEGTSQEDTSLEIKNSKGESNDESNGESNGESNNESNDGSNDESKVNSKVNPKDDSIEIFLNSSDQFTDIEKEIFVGDKEVFKQELFYFLKTNPFLLFAIIDDVESYKMIQDFENKYKIKGLYEKFIKIKKKWYEDHIEEELDGEEIKKFSNYYSSSTIDGGKGKIEIRENDSAIVDDWNKVINDGKKISDLKNYILKYSSKIRNDSYFKDMEKPDLEKLAEELFINFDDTPSFYEEYIDEDDFSKFNSKPLEWAKEKVIYYSDKAYFGIPCIFICMMKENWIHGNFELLGGRSTRWLCN